MEERKGSGMIERYKDKAISSLWHPFAVYLRWFEVEVAHVRAIAGDTVGDALTSVNPPSAHQVNYHERQTGHDVAAFLRALDRNIQAKATEEADSSVLPSVVWDQVRSSLHYGLTSSDVVDTALALGLLRSKPTVEDRVVDCHGAVQRLADSFSPWDVTLGRTHGQLAAPMAADHRWQVLAEMIERSWTRAEVAFDFLDVGKLSGPMGSADLSNGRALDQLGLRETTATQLVPRDRLAHWAHCMAELATVAEAVVTQVWLLAQSGIDELRLEAPPESIGSSAMPHKTNPVRAENVRGLARLARAQADTLQLGIVQWGEHDLAHSSVERIAIPDLLHLTCTILSRTAALVAGVSWTDLGWPSGYRNTNEELLILQANGTAYIDAHAQLTALYRDGKIAEITITEEGQ